MEQGMCQFMSYPKELYYSNEDKVNFLFLLKFFMFTFCFWIPTIHSLTFFLCLCVFDGKVIIFQEAL
jgi:hypothetical protein